MAHNKQFATYRSAILRAFTLITFLTITVLSAMPEVGRGQCPPDGFGGHDWAGPFSKHVELLGTTCWVTYTYCEASGVDPTLGPYHAYVPESITPDPGCTGCDGLSPDQMIKLLLHQLNTSGNDVAYGAPPPCTDGTFQYDVQYAMDCWIETVNGDGSITYSSCADASDYCESTWEYCSNPDGSINAVKLSATSNDDGTCTALPSPDNWTAGVCYDIAPCGTSE